MVVFLVVFLAVFLGAVFLATVFLGAAFFLGAGFFATFKAGGVLGADGFSYSFNGTRNIKIPQIGRLRIGDDVEIGANTCIDRAFLDETVVGSGSKLDNLVQIAHNAALGQDVLIAAQSGVAGSSILEDGVQLGVKMTE